MASRSPNSYHTVHASLAYAVPSRILFIVGDIISPIDVDWDALK
jgi:hypothetical protein